MTREEFISNWNGSSPDDRFDFFVQWLMEENEQAHTDFTLSISQSPNEGVIPTLSYDEEEDVEIIVSDSLFTEQTPDPALEAGDFAIDFIKDKYKEKKEKEEEEKEQEKAKEKEKKLEELIEKLQEALDKGEDIKDLIEDSEFSGLDEFQDLLDELDFALTSAGLDESEIEDLKEMLGDIKDKLKELLKKYGSL